MLEPAWGGVFAREVKKGLRPAAWWQWPTILSLDAPLVAATWQMVLFRAARLPARAAPAFVLCASVWLSYAADRWIEGWRLPLESVRTQRHRFYQDHRWRVAALWLCVLAANLAVAWAGLTARQIEAGVVLLLAVLMYVLSHQLFHRHVRWRLPKELCVAGLLAAGAALFPATSPHAVLGPAFWLVLTAFALLCFDNCALISVWEHAVDAAHGQISLARQFRFAQGLARTATAATALFGFVLVLWLRPSPPGAAAVAVSALLLGLVDAIQPAIGRRAARVLADAVLLTPAIGAAVQWAARRA
jgi:hypothetical protein